MAAGNITICNLDGAFDTFDYCNQEGEFLLMETGDEILTEDSEEIELE
jgi:hypothetical protein